MILVVPLTAPSIPKRRACIRPLYGELPQGSYTKGRFSPCENFLAALATYGSFADGFDVIVSTNASFKFVHFAGPVMAAE